MGKQVPSLPPLPSPPHKMCLAASSGGREAEGAWREKTGCFQGPPNADTKAARSGFERMKILWMMAVLLVSAEGSLIEFGRMIKEETGKTAFPFYTFYGCYCGLGGKGRPRDATDRCCLMHDCCYENLTECRTKTDPYQYSREGGLIRCEGGTWCKKQICECDKDAATCLRDNLDTYNKEYRFYGDSNCKEGPKNCEVSAGQDKTSTQITQS